MLQIARTRMARTCLPRGPVPQIRSPSSSAFHPHRPSTRSISTSGPSNTPPSPPAALSRHLATVADTKHAPFHDHLPPVHLPDTPIMTSHFPQVPPIPQANGPVQLILPPTEDRPHRYLTLPNGIEAIVVSDPKADKAAASMDVGVGHLSDPPDLPGCAHFCEHLLFMGTEKYPIENAYQTFLSSHNGHSNAYTAMTSTVYYFDIAADALEDALDRFSGFFKEPLFNEDCTEREIKAVDSEHKKNLQNDMWRFFQMEKHLANKDHPYHKFGTGNYESLWSKPKSEGRDPRQQLIDWWKKYYCARRMKLVVVGKEDLDTLEKWVREQFEAVPVRSQGLEPVGEEGVRIAFSQNPFGPKQMGTVTFTKPIQDVRGLEITFPFPDVDHLFQSKPASYLTHFLGHEGRGSILSYLKNNGWVNQLRAGLSHGAAGFDFMKITVDLTPSGLDNWKKVALAIFKYVNLLRAAPPSSTAFNEIKAIADISFKFAEKTKNGTYATVLSNWMQKPLPRDKVVSGISLLEEFRPDEVAAALQLLDPRRAIVGITTREIPKDIEATFDTKEPIYGTEYTVMKIPEDLLGEAMTGAPIPELQLPGRNLFIPERLDVEKFDVKEPTLRPELLRNNDLSRLWYKRDDTFWLPKTNVHIELESPLLNNTPRNAVLGRLLCDLFRDSITEDTYDADLAELSFHLAYGGESISVAAGGFSDKLAVLLETMLTRFVNFKIDAQRYESVVDDVRLNWTNFALHDPYRQVLYWQSYTTANRTWTQEEKLKELEHIKPEDVQAYGKDVLSRLFVETLIHGDVSPSGAKEIQDMVERVLAPRALAEAEKHTTRTLLLSPGSEFVWSRAVPNPSEVNNAITYSTQIGEITDRKLRASLQLFAQIASEPIFDQLRTKEQLGYITQGFPTQSVGIMSYRVLCQSERDPAYVESRIEAIFDYLKTHLETMTPEEFEKHRAALISKKEEKPKNLGEESKRYWSAISDKFYEFGKPQSDIEYLRRATKDDVVSLLMEKVHPLSATRAKISTHLCSQFRGVKFDPASAQSLVEAFVKNGVVVDQVALQTLIASGPDLQAVKDFALAAVGKAASASATESPSLSPQAKEELVKMIEDLQGVAADSAEAAEQGKKLLRPSNVFIDDIHTFKASLTPSKAPIPLEPFSAVTPRL